MRGTRADEAMTMRKGMLDRNDRKALHKGFLDGFLSAGWFFASKSLVDSRKYEVSVSRAWSDVGRAFSEVLKTEGAIRGQKARVNKERSRSRTAA